MILTLIEKPTNLTKREYRFQMFENTGTIILDTYHDMKRKTARHGYKKIKSYIRIPMRQDVVMKIEDVPVPINLKETLMRLIEDELEVVWQ